MGLESKEFGSLEINVLGFGGQRSLGVWSLMCWECLWDVVEGFGSEAAGSRLSYTDRQKAINVLWHAAWDETDPIEQFKCYLRGQSIQNDLHEAGENAQNS